MGRIKDKSVFYRRVGRIGVTLWIASVAIATVFLFPTIAEEIEIQHLGSTLLYALMIFISAIVTNFFLNPLCFLGGLFLWRADKNATISIKSKWPTFIIAYIIIWIFLCVFMIVVQSYLKNAARGLGEMYHKGNPTESLIKK